MEGRAIEKFRFHFSILSLSSFPSLKRDCSSPLCKIHAYTMRKKWKVEQSKNFDRYRFRKKSRSIFNTLSISEKYSSPSCKIHACTIQPRSVRKKWKVEQSKNFDRSRIDFESEAPLWRKISPYEGDKEKGASIILVPRFPPSFPGRKSADPSPDNAALSIS